jgi:hypothetical protein
MTKHVIKELISQLIALVFLFAGPAIQYFVLKRFAKREGAPELWYLPKYGFRLVVRNIPGKKVLTDIKVMVRLRAVVPRSEGTSGGTFMDEMLVNEEEMFVFPRTDQLMICFKLQRASDSSGRFIVTDKLGVEKRSFMFTSFDRLVCDYVANVKNWLNFDIKIAKRAELTSETRRF